MNQVIDYQGQQGDVLLTRIQSLPKEFQEVEKQGNKTILALGEATGHHHRFESDNVKMFSANDNNVMRRFVVIENGPATLFHEEHAPHTYAPGIYEIKIAREWTDQNEPRQVVD